MKKKQILLSLAALISLAVLLIIGSGTAYLTDVEVADNVISIGKISVKLDESPFDPEETYPIVPGSKTLKAPTLENDGNKDEFVFLKVSVPKAKVTLLEESGTNKGKPKTGLTEVYQQVFKAIADPPSSGDSNVSFVEAQTGKDIAFGYHSDKTGGVSSAGWVLLSAEKKTITVGTETAYRDEYVFGYNKKLVPNEKTVTLFDAVQLKSFIDGELKDDVAIDVYGYGIQADNLKGVAGDMTAEYLTKETLTEIYTIVKNKSEAKQ